VAKQAGILPENAVVATAIRASTLFVCMDAIFIAAIILVAEAAHRVRVPVFLN
jgi:hypothetical protein